MSIKNEHIIIYTFQSLEDPLIKGLMLQYLLDLNKEKKYTFHLITFEQPAFSLDENSKAQKKIDLIASNIFWYPVDYHNGRLLLLKKSFDFIKTFLICARIKWKYKNKIILGFLPIAAGFSSIISTIMNMKLVVYCFEPHSEYMADFKIWNRKSLKYLLLKKFEREQLELASSVVVPTNYTNELVNQINPRARKYILPISIDTDQNIFRKDKIEELRKEWNISNEKVILYMGKFGGIYYSVSQMLEFFEGFRQFSTYHILIISSDKAEVERTILSMGLNNDFYTVIDFIPYTEISGYISAADIGLVAVPPLPSQKYRTPVKTGLYLSCGIPFIVNVGIAEDDILANEERVGVVVDDLLKVNMNILNQNIHSLLVDNQLTERCRNVAVKYRSHQKAVSIINSIFKDILEK